MYTYSSLLVRAFLTSILFICLASIATHAQRKILVRLVDSSNQKPIPDALATSDNPDNKTRSNYLGFFEFVANSADKRLKVSCIGYETLVVPMPQEEKVKISMTRAYTRLDVVDLNLYPSGFPAIKVSRKRPANEASPLDYMAVHQDGVYAFYHYVGNALAPAAALFKNGLTEVSFTIGADGKASDIVVTDSTAAASEIRKVLATMTPWNPAHQNARPTPQHFVMSILNPGLSNGPSNPFVEINKYVHGNIRYPAAARTRDVEGVVCLAFVIDDEGALMEFKVLHDVDSTCSAEVKRCLREMPPVLLQSLRSMTNATQFVLPVAFSINKKLKNVQTCSAPGAVPLELVEVTAIGVVRDQHASDESSPFAFHASGISLENSGKFGSLELANTMPAHVKWLSLAGRSYTSFPNDILKYTNLQLLDLEKNSIKSLPTDVALLSKLLGLFLFENNLDDLPNNFGDLQKLKALALGSNKFSTFPMEILLLRRLTELDLGNNQLQSVPDAIATLKSLRVLVLQDNQLQHLPRGFYEMKNLEKLYLAGNPLASEEVDALRKALPKTLVFF